MQEDRPTNAFDRMAAAGVDMELYQQSQNACAKAMESTGEDRLNHLADAIKLLVDADPTSWGLSREYIEKTYTHFDAFDLEEIDNALNRLVARDEVTATVHERFSTPDQG